MADNFACKTLDPNNPAGAKVDAVFPGFYTTRLYKFSPVAYENLRAAKHVLDYPERIFFGVREFNEGGWCYTGRPTHWFVKERTIVPFPDGRVFAVYLNPQMHVYECRAEYAANDDPLSPVDWQERYRGLAWRSKRTS